MMELIEDSKCSYCLSVLTPPFIKCEECANVYLCSSVEMHSYFKTPFIQCFSMGVEAGVHRRSHKYFVKRHAEQYPSSLFDDWSCAEEIKLLEALEQYGVGNWEDISEKVQSRNPDECMNHYSRHYIGGVLGTELLSVTHHSHTVTDHTSTNQNCMSPSLYPTATIISMTSEDQQLLGYMPQRDDFERDYDNDAESLLARLNSTYTDDDLEAALKIAQVSIYTQRLRDRQRRKQIAREQGLIGHIMAHILNRRIKRTAISAAAGRAPVPIAPPTAIATTAVFTTPAPVTSLKLAPQTASSAANGNQAVDTPQVVKRRRGRPPSPNKATSRTAPRQLTLQSLGFTSKPAAGALAPPPPRAASPPPTVEQTCPSPPPGSWLAAPFVVQSSGTTRGHVMVAGGLSPRVHSRSSQPSARLTPAAPGSETTGALPPTMEDYDAFHINERLKPFLRYFTAGQGKQFLDNLSREEVLKLEISHLLELRQKSRTRLNGVKLKSLSVRSSSVYVPVVKVTTSLLDGEMGGEAAETAGGVGSQRLVSRRQRRSLNGRNRTTPSILRRKRYRRNAPWYMKTTKRR